MWRNASRCWRASTASRAAAYRTATLAAVLTLGIPLLSQAAVSQLNSRAMMALQSGSEREFTGAVQTLKLLKFGVSTDEIVYAYERVTDPKQRERLAQAYQTITGRDIADRLAELD